MMDFVQTNFLRDIHKKKEARNEPPFLNRKNITY